MLSTVNTCREKWIFLAHGGPFPEFHKPGGGYWDCQGVCKRCIDLLTNQQPLFAEHHQASYREHIIVKFVDLLIESMTGYSFKEKKLDIMVTNVLK